ncbi:MAG: lytic transglycosylase domain-containing protein, partial [Saprospiraceae bacterium]
LLFGTILGAILLAGLLAFMANAHTDGDDPATPSYGEERTLPQVVKGVTLKDAYNFAGEALPMDNFDVRERLERELLRNAYFHSNTLLIIKRTKRYFPVIERILREEGLPEDLKYLAVAESDLEMVTSPAGARGLWQFMPAVARQYGLEVNNEVDERYHAEKSTRAVVNFLKNYYNQFGTWHYVAAAYNMGEGNMRKFQKAQTPDSYFDLNINQETMRYLFRIVAIKEIIENPTAFGFYVNKEDYYPTLDKFEERAETQSIPDLAVYARQRGTSYRMLKVYNPWLIDDNLPISQGNSYSIRVPK